MAELRVHSLIGYAWEALAVVWLASMPFAKRTIWAQPAASRLFQPGVILRGFLLVGSDQLRQGWLGVQFWPETFMMQLSGLVLTISGCTFAIWARMALGANWSGAATVKQDHELVVKGPYRLTRHPIYTGILTACLGSALASCEWRCVLGLVIIVLGLMLKISQEERLMIATFPNEYPQYQRRVKALIPGLL
jgi:protein-S-isoprenylcysteine O-methyltransferase Ste14